MYNFKKPVEFLNPQDSQKVESTNIKVHEKINSLQLATLGKGG